MQRIKAIQWVGLSTVLSYLLSVAVSSQAFAKPVELKVGHLRFLSSSDVGKIEDVKKIVSEKLREKIEKMRAEAGPVHSTLPHSAREASADRSRSNRNTDQRWTDTVIDMDPFAPPVIIEIPRAEQYRNTKVNLFDAELNRLESPEFSTKLENDIINEIAKKAAEIECASHRTDVQPYVPWTLIRETHNSGLFKWGNSSPNQSSLSSGKATRKRHGNKQRVVQFDPNDPDGKYLSVSDDIASQPATDSAGTGYYFDSIICNDEPGKDDQYAIHMDHFEARDVRHVLDQFKFTAGKISELSNPVSCANIESNSSPAWVKMMKSPFINHQEQPYLNIVKDTVRLIVVNGTLPVALNFIASGTIPSYILTASGAVLAGGLAAKFPPIANFDAATLSKIDSNMGILNGHETLAQKTLLMNQKELEVIKKKFKLKMNPGNTSGEHLYEKNLPLIQHAITLLTAIDSTGNQHRSNSTDPVEQEEFKKMNYALNTVLTMPVELKRVFDPSKPEHNREKQKKLQNYYHEHDLVSPGNEESLKKEIDHVVEVADGISKGIDEHNISTRPYTFITGARQSGKSTLVNLIADVYDEKPHKITLDKDKTVNDIRKELDKFLLESKYLNQVILFECNGKIGDLGDSVKELLKKMFKDREIEYKEGTALLQGTNIVNKINGKVVNIPADPIFHDVSKVNFFITSEDGPEVSTAFDEPMQRIRLNSIGDKVLLNNAIKRFELKLRLISPSSTLLKSSLAAPIINKINQIIEHGSKASERPENIMKAVETYASFLEKKASTSNSPDSEFSIEEAYTSILNKHLIKKPKPTGGSTVEKSTETNTSPD